MPDPEVEVRELLRRRAPKFVLFKDNDRSILPTYNAADENLRENVPIPLRNLLVVAETSIDEIWERVQEGSTTNLRTLQRRINDTLKSKIAPMWTQSELSIEVTINQSGIFEVNIIELDSPDLTVTPISERSDGLRTFLALACFLIAQALEIPPILLIDEAERNLHYDAQADLIRVLTRDLQVSKIVYTTHSPGCLPLDLGTGILVVERDSNDLSISRLQNNFWTDTEPGFSRLLFAMGAEVASFSAFRRAVLAEGVSEMMLLPTLFRNATAQKEIDFQIAFGLSNMSAAKALGSVALITVFLLDGDNAGDKKKRKLVKEGVPESHIFQLPPEKAIEDLIDRKTYLDVVDSVLQENHGMILERGALSSTENIARAVDLYCAATPGIEEKVSHKIVAFRLAEIGVDLKLSSLGKSYLPKLRNDIEAALETTYVLTPPTE